MKYLYAIKSEALSKVFRENGLFVKNTSYQYIIREG